MVFSWLFRGPHFGQILLVLALEKFSVTVSLRPRCAQVRDPTPRTPKKSKKRSNQHPSPNVKNFPRFQPQIWPEIITSRDAKSTCFKGSRTSCDVISFRIFGPNFGRKRSHHVMDASCRKKVRKAHYLVLLFLGFGVLSRKTSKLPRILCPGRTHKILERKDRVGTKTLPKLICNRFRSGKFAR